MSDAKIGIEAEIAALAKLSPLEYQQQRKDVATRLSVGLAFLDKQGKPSKKRSSLRDKANQSS